MGVSIFLNQDLIRQILETLLCIFVWLKCMKYYQTKKDRKQWLSSGLLTKIWFWIPQGNLFQNLANWLVIQAEECWWNRKGKVCFSIVFIPLPCKPKTFIFRVTTHIYIYTWGLRTLIFHGFGVQRLFLTSFQGGYPLSTQFVGLWASSLKMSQQVKSKTHSSVNPTLIRSMDSIFSNTLIP